MSTEVKPKKKSKKGLAITLVILAAVVGGGSYYGYQMYTKRAAADAMSQTTVNTAALEKTSLTDYIAVSGTIYSGNSQNVYTTQSYPIKEVYVEVGDTVKAGDLLAVLDMSNLDRDIQQAEISLSNSIKSTEDSQQSAVNSVENAEMSVATAELNLAKQQLSYDTLKDKLENLTSNDLINAKNSIDTAKQNLETAEREVDTKTRDYDTKVKDYETDKVLLGAGGISQYELDTSLQAVENAQTSLENAKTSYETAQSNYDKALETYDRTLSNLKEDLVTAGKDLENSRLSYQNAQNSLTQSQKKVSNVTSNVESQQISLLKLKEQRSEAEIIAPVDGTVTVVNATVGMTGTGSAGSGSSGTALFVIEDMNDLYVSTSIKEFRIGEVAYGQDALVTTDATSEQIFKGYLSFIAPTATEASSTSNVEFEVKVQLLEVDPNLRIGMNAYANIILEAQEDIFAVSYDAVVTGPGGESVVYAVENGVVVEIPVETGMETDTMTEISGERLREGMILILTPSAVTPGQAYDAQTGQDTGAPTDGMPARGERPEGAEAGQRGGEGGTRPEGGAMPEGQGGGGMPPDAPF